MIPFIFLGVFLACYFMAIKTLAPTRSRNRLLLEAFVLLAAPRVGVLWFLIPKHWSGTLEAQHQPLFLFLLPEVLAMPRETEWTSLHAGLMTVLLICGSGLVAWAVVGLVKKTRPEST